MDFNQLQTTNNQWNSIISYEQADKSPASFHLLSGVNQDIPLVSRKLNIIETMNTLCLPNHSIVYMKIQERNKKEWINKQNNQKNKQTKAEIIPSNIYSNYEERENEIVLDA